MGSSNSVNAGREPGYVMLAKQMLSSEVMKMHPMYLALWVWMLLKANYTDQGTLGRGQLLTSIEEMQEAMSYYVGWRKETPSKDQIRSAYEALKRATMITTRKTIRGMVITICNYDKYQNPRFYEAHSEAHEEDATKSTMSPHYKERSIRSKKKEEEESRPDGLSLDQVIDSFNEICTSLPKAKVTETGKKKFRPEVERTPDLAEWETVFRKAEASDFLSGRNGKWTGCSFNWLLLEENRTKVKQGNYDNSRREREEPRLVFDEEKTRRVSASMWYSGLSQEESATIERELEAKGRKTYDGEALLPYWEEAKNARDKKVVPLEGSDKPCLRAVDLWEASQFLAMAA